eukprot:COSAG06_NODE_1172_length_10425_cov_7.741042_1_plen_222_part_00
MKDADGTDALYSVASEVDLGKTIPIETFQKVQGAATPGDLEIEVKLRLRDLYTDGQSHEGFVREIEAYVHKNGEKIEDGIRVPFAIIANDQAKTLNVPEAGHYNLSARMKTVGGDTRFQGSAPFAVAAPVVAPLAVGTRAQRVKNVGTADESEALADESEANRVASMVRYDSLDYLRTLAHYISVLITARHGKASQMCLIRSGVAFGCCELEYFLSFLVSE